MNHFAEALMTARLPEHDSPREPSGENLRFLAAMRSAAWSALAALPDGAVLPAEAQAQAAGLVCDVIVRRAGSDARPPASGAPAELLTFALDDVELALLACLVGAGKPVSGVPLQLLAEARLNRRLSEGPLKFTLARLVRLGVLSNDRRSGYVATEAGRRQAALLNEGRGE